MEERDETIHWVATVGSTTERGGRIVGASSEGEFDGFQAALVGDVVVYDDGTESTIIDGSGYAATWANTPFALVGSSLSNGDKIVTTPQSAFGIVVKDGEKIPGLFERGFVPADRPVRG
ncbi:PAAR domain-containing protein [Caballeronia glebae]|uniref:PAAR domain-containing protein n=1 Tax=Caballeronia glebae TaxID=1777143 RepID=UPI0038B6FD04